jgi:hypothetical protein
MREMRVETRQAGPPDEAGAQEFLERDNAEADESGSKRMAMEDSDAGERRREKQKIDQHGEIVSAEIRGEARAGHLDLVFVRPCVAFSP